MKTFGSATFLDLQSLADEWYTTSSIAGSSVDLSTLVDASGAAFPGIDDTGIWMNALFCDKLQQPGALVDHHPVALPLILDGARFCRYIR